MICFEGTEYHYLVPTPGDCERNKYLLLMDKAIDILHVDVMALETYCIQHYNDKLIDELSIEEMAEVLNLILSGHFSL